MYLKREACLIAGQWITGDHWFEVDDPATGKLIGRAPDLGASQTFMAIDAAAEAMPAWAATSARNRAIVLRRLAELMNSYQDDLAALLTAEQGKPLSEAKDEIDYSVRYFEWFAEEGRRAYGEVIPANEAGQRLFVLRQPVGVVGAITPWNFPSAMVARKLAPALASGCGCIVKPAHQTPFSAIAIGVLAQEAGVPSGLLNIVTGLNAAEIGSALTSSPIVRKLSFTGSTAVGARLYSQCAPTIKKLSLELGGNAPFIVFEDADMDAAVTGAIQSKFRNAGQTCVSTNRFYVQERAAEEFTHRLAERMTKLKVGPGDRADTQVGPLIEISAVEKVEAHVRDALAHGASLELGGRRHDIGERFYEPTLLTGVTPGMRVLDEETFGPLAAVVKFATEEEVIGLANASASGLAAYVYTRDNARLWRIAEAVQVGMIGANSGFLSTEVAPFGGVKQSGFGREGSRHGLDEYMVLKYVNMTLAEHTPV